MNEELMRQVDTLQKNADGIVRPEVNRNPVTPFLSLPGLIGFWPMATVQRSTGNVPNYAPFYSGASTQDMAYNGNPTFSYLDTGVPFINLDGTGDYLVASDNTDLDVIGNESWAAIPGLMTYQWVFFDDVTTQQGIFTKYLNSTNRSWWLQVNAGTLSMSVSTTGAAAAEVVSASVSINQWYFIATRFNPSTALSLWVNDNKNTETATVPATLFNSSGNLHIGSLVGAVLPLNAKLSLCAICANRHSDAMVQSVYQQTRSLFGV